jgi:hypothetical protein
MTTLRAFDDTISLGKASTTWRSIEWMNLERPGMCHSIVAVLLY